MDQQVTLPPFSMLVKTPIYQDDGIAIPGLFRPPIVPDVTDDSYEVPLAGERRLDLISNLHYGTSHLWWIIASVNGIIDPLAGVKRGTILRIPHRSRLTKAGILNV